MNYKNIDVKKYIFVSLKSFGDLTIASKHIEMLFDEDRKKLRLWVGNYHSELIDALQLKSKIDVIELKHGEIPSFYDIKNKGLKSAILSLMDVRKSFKLQYIHDETLIFDRLNFREKYLTYGMNKISLMKGQNIYLNYKETILRLFGRIKDYELVAGPGRDILICPYASKTFRNIPSNLIDDISIRCIKNGFHPIVYMFDDESPLSCKVPTIIKTKKSFQNLRLSMENAHAIVSADSFGTHMAAFISRPVFVVSPYIETMFWLPPTAYEKKYWGLYSKRNEMLNTLDKFLIDLKNCIN